MAWSQKSLTGFTGLDPEQFSAAAKIEYDMYREYRATANLYKEKFEAIMHREANLPKGQKLVFKYGLNAVQVGVSWERDLPKPKSKREPVDRSLKGVLGKILK